MNFEEQNKSKEEQIDQSEERQEKVEDTTSPEEQRELADSWLKYHSLDMSNLYIRKFDKILSNDDIKPGTYNAVNGVVLFNINGKIGALPSNEKVMDMIRKSELRNDESIGVPNLNNTEVWGNESERSQNSAFKEWLDIHSKFSN